MSTVIGVDVGGTSIKAALFDQDMRGIEQCTRPTPAHGREPAKAVADEVADVVAELAKKAEERPAAVGVMVPGVVDESTGIARYAGNVGWRDAPMAELLTERIEYPVAFGHDVRAGGLAEAELGAGKGFGTSLFLSIGTGISAALVINGELYSSGGYAGELGHLDVGSGRECVCGAVGCLETVATAPAISAAYRERTGRELGSEEVLASPDAAAREVTEELLEALVTALAAVTTLFAPEVLVCGGGVFGAGDRLLDPLAERLARRLTFQRVPALRLAELGSAAGSVGAGLLARRLTA